MSQGYWLALSDAFGRVAAGIARFVRYELDLAAMEAREDLSRLLKAARLLALGVAIAVGALAALFAAAIGAVTALLVAIGVQPALAGSLAALLVALALGLAAWRLFKTAGTGLRDLMARLERIMTVFAESAAQPRERAADAKDGGIIT